MGSTEDTKNPGNEIVSTALVKHMKAWRSIAVLCPVLGCDVASAANPRAIGHSAGGICGMTIEDAP